MIVAAALSSEGGEPPPDLEALWYWRYFHLPPRGGGQLNQIAGQLERMKVFQEAHNLWNIFIHRPAQWTKALAGRWPVLNYIAWLILFIKPPGYTPPRGVRNMAREHVKQTLKERRGR